MSEWEKVVLVVAFAVILWRLSDVRSLLLAVQKELSGERDLDAILPNLSGAECEQLGWKMGEAHVLDGEWDRIWAREYQFACRKKFVMLGFNKLSKVEAERAVKEYNDHLRESEKGK